MNLAGLFERAKKKLSVEDLAQVGEALRTAADQGDLDAVKKLHASGADVNYSHVNQGTALIAAAGENHAPVVDYLLKLKADVSLTNMFNQTALHIAVRQGDNNAIALSLIEAASPLNGRDTHGATPSFYAAQNAKAEVLTALAGKSADFTIANKKGVTPLMQATMASHTEAIDVLVKHECGLDAQDDEGRTALMHAVIGRNAALVRQYLSLGANFDARDKNGDTALAIAKKFSSREEVADILEQAAAARLVPFYAGTNSNVPIMKRLVLKGAAT